MDARYIFALAALLVAAAGAYLVFYGGGPQVLPTASAYGVKDDSGATQETVSTVTHGINRFGTELLKQMEKNSNVFISPMSIEFALAIAAEGARGKPLTRWCLFFTCRRTVLCEGQRLPGYTTCSTGRATLR